MSTAINSSLTVTVRPQEIVLENKSSARAAQILRNAKVLFCYSRFIEGECPSPAHERYVDEREAVEKAVEWVADTYKVHAGLD